jgi:hypothetical protein
VRLDGRDHYCGPWRSKAAEAEYDRLVGVFLANGRRMPRDAEERGSLTVTELVAQYWSFAKGYYRRPDGTPSSEVSCIKVAITELRRLAGELPAREFGPLRLKALQDAMIAKRWARRSINLHVGRIRRVFAWGVQNEVVPPEVLMALKALPGLKAGLRPPWQPPRVRSNVSVRAALQQPLVALAVGAPAGGMKSKAPHRSGSDTEKYYRGLLREQSRSGQSVRAFAAARGLSAWTLDGWRQRLGLARSRTQPESRAGVAPKSWAPTSRLVEVCLGEATPAERPSGLVLHVFGRHRVELPTDFAEDDVRRLVRALAPC